jgi:hypothetical protein
MHGEISILIKSLTSAIIDKETKEDSAADMSRDVVLKGFMTMLTRLLMA